MRGESLAVSTHIASLFNILTPFIANLRLFSEDKQCWEITPLERRQIVKYFPMLVDHAVC